MKTTAFLLLLIGTPLSGAHSQSPFTEPLGMREFGIRTPDGHRIRFGEPVVAAARGR